MQTLEFLGAPQLRMLRGTAPPMLRGQPIRMLRDATTTELQLLASDADTTYVFEQILKSIFNSEPADKQHWAVFSKKPSPDGDVWVVQDATPSFTTRYRNEILGASVVGAALLAFTVGRFTKRK